MSDVTIIEPNPQEITVTINDGVPGPPGPAGPTSLPVSEHAVWVSKEGDDGNTGRNQSVPKATITSAISVAETMLTAGAPSVAINIMDAGRYTEDLNIPDDVHIIGFAAELVGNHVIGDNASLVVHSLYRGSGASEMVDKAGAPNTHGYIRCFYADTRGIDGTLTGSSGFRNSSGGSILHVQFAVLVVGASTIGFTDGGGGGDFGHVHGLGSDIYLAGNGATMCRTGSGGSKLLFSVDHILEFGSPSNTTGPSLNHPSSEVWLRAGQIIADRAWDVNSGDLYVTCPDIRGAKDGNAVDSLILQSPNGSSWRITVDDSGAIGAAPV
jgi:hypothetical protein